MRTLRASFASRLGRGFSSQPAAPGSRLAALRDVLEADGESSWTDDAFAVATQPAPEKRRRKQHTPHPPWLHVPKPGGADFQRIRSGLRKSKLATVCEEARCPNIGECWGGRKGTATATIMVMGDTCTRGCRFCNVKTSRTPPPIAADEPEQTADQIATWGVDYVVITSVDRDDLPDGGSSHFARVVRRVKEVRPDMRLECLTPDFNNTSGLAGVAEVATSGLDVYAHNIETVPRLQASVRDRRANWADSLKVLEHAKVARPGLVTKTSIMLGLGEEPDEVCQPMRATACHRTALGHAAGRKG
jgi:lipoic acid synthetase